MKNALLKTSSVSAKWLNAHLYADNLIILDATMVSVNDSDDSQHQELIPGAQVVDLKTQFSDVAQPFPNTCPSITQFETAVNQLGIGSQSVVIVYDRKGVYSSPRLWWLFKYFGHDQVAVLNGGLPEWKRRNGLTVSENNSQNSNRPYNYRANLRSNCIIKFDQISSISQNQNYQIIDARSRARFEGLEPEPRKGLRGGHIRNSINLPYTELLIDGKLKPKSELQAIFSKLNVLEKRLVFTCGSGITACIVALAADTVGLKNSSVYDGSWTEYATLTPQTE